MRNINFKESNIVFELLSLSISLFFFFVEVHGVHFYKIMTDMRLHK
jgi:hypothetical protein